MISFRFPPIVQFAFSERFSQTGSAEEVVFIANGHGSVKFSGHEKRNMAMRVRYVAGGSSTRRLRRDAGAHAVNRIGSGETAFDDWAIRAGSDLPAVVRGG